MHNSGTADEVQLKLFSLVQVESPERQLKWYEICSFHPSLHLSFPLPLPRCHFPVSHRVQLAVSRCGSKNPLNLISSSSLSQLHLNYSPLKAKWESERGRHHLGPSRRSNIIFFHLIYMLLEFPKSYSCYLCATAPECCGKSLSRRGSSENVRSEEHMPDHNRFIYTPIWTFPRGQEN